MRDSDMRYINELEGVASDAVALIMRKTQTYGDSWKRRGGAGAYFTAARPIDRLEGIVKQYGYDIFAAIADAPEGGDGTALDAITDVMNYMILTLAHARAAILPKGDPTAGTAGVTEPIYPKSDQAAGIGNG